MDYDFTDFEMDDEEHDEENKFFRLREDAIKCLWEELYDSANDINKDAIYNALRFLMYKEDMFDLLQDFRDYDYDDICVKHKSRR